MELDISLQTENIILKSNQYSLPYSKNKVSEVLHAGQNGYNHMFIFQLFRICAIITDKQLSKKLFMLFCNSVCGIAISSINILFFMQKDSSISRANFALLTISFVHRCALCRRIDRFKKLSVRITKLLEKLKIVHTKKLMYILACLSALMITGIIVCAISSNFQLAFEHRVYGLHPRSVPRILNISIISLFCFIIGPGLLIPMSVFSIYYTLICLNIQDILK